MPDKDCLRPVLVFLIAALWPPTAAPAGSSGDLLAQLEQAVVDEDEKAAIALWERLTPGFDALSAADQGRYLVVQGLIQEDIRRDIDSAEQSFNRAITLLDAEPQPTQALADAYYERGYIRYLRTHDTTQYCPDREKAVDLTRRVNTQYKLVKYLTALSFCYADSPANLQRGLAVLSEALTLAESLQLKPSEHALIYNATAILYRKNQLYDQAYQYSELAYAQRKASGDLAGMNIQQHNLLSNALGMGELDKAEKHAAELLALADSAPQFREFRFFALYDSGQVALARDDWPRAIRLFEQARGEESNTQESLFIATNRALLASAYFLNGDVGAALREAAVASRLPGFQSMEPQQKQFVLSLRQYSDMHPVQAMQTLFTMYRAAQKRQWEFLANNSLEHARRHNSRIQKYETQLLENQVQIQQLKLDAQQKQQEASRLYLLLAAVIAASLALLAFTLWRSRRRFRTLAQTDPLTGIANRRHFLERARQVAGGNRAEPQTASVLVLDIDHFKLINDAHGHQAGDAAIRHVASHANSCLRREDVLGRTGGEEFAVLLPATDEATAWKVAEHIRQVVERTPLDHHGEEIYLTVSIGLMTGPLTRDNIETLMQCADKVMYRAKNAGRNRSLAHTDQYPALASLAAVDSAFG
jgi:diguanylate cyclase (GGDEF)-like protein